MECSLAPMLKACGTAGLSSGNLLAAAAENAAVHGMAVGVASRKGRVPGGVQAFGPDDPTPSWAEEGDE